MVTTRSPSLPLPSSLPLLSITLRSRNIHTVQPMQQTLIEVYTLELVRPVRAVKVDIRRNDVAARRVLRADQVSDKRLVGLARRAAEVGEEDVGDGEVRLRILHVSLAAIRDRVRGK